MNGLKVGLTYQGPLTPPSPPQAGERSKGEGVWRSFQTISRPLITGRPAGGVAQKRRRGMKRQMGFFGIVLVLGFVFSFSAYGAEPIIIGVPTSTGFVEGKECLTVVKMAVEEINAKGGVKVGSEKRPFKVESIDIRDAAPGVPVPEALLGIEKLILEKKPTALLIGPFRSEALLAGMDIISKYKVPMIGTIAMTPASEEKVKKEPDKYKYIFRTCLNAKYLVQYLIGSHVLHQQGVRIQQGLHHAPGRGMGARDGGRDGQDLF